MSLMTIGKAKIAIQGRRGVWIYEGEVDRWGTPTGEGEAVGEFGDSYKGTWFEGLIHGYCKLRLLQFQI